MAFAVAAHRENLHDRSFIVKSSVLRAALPVALLSLALVTGCSGSTENTVDNDSVQHPTPQPTSTWQPAPENKYDPCAIVHQAEAARITGTSLRWIDPNEADPYDWTEPSSTRACIFTDHKPGTKWKKSDEDLTVTTKVLAKHDDGRDSATEAYGSTGTMLRGIASGELGLKDKDTEVLLLVRGSADPGNFYPDPTAHDLAHPLGVFIWQGNIRLTIRSTTPAPRADLLALATKAAARMNLK